MRWPCSVRLCVYLFFLPSDFISINYLAVFLGSLPLWSLIFDILIAHWIWISTRALLLCDFGLPPLLANVPLGSAHIGFGLTIFTCAVVFGRRTNQIVTATRSQVRVLRLSSFQTPWIVIFLLGILLTGVLSTRGEGSAITMDSRGAVSAKTHGMEQLSVLGPRSFAKTTRKRSFIRAQRRLHRFGFTWYRGRLTSGPIYPHSHKQIDSAPRSLHPPHQSQRHLQRRLNCMSWNAGGLSIDSWDFIKTWLSDHSLDLLMIQETHWMTQSEWTIPGYSCFHSGFSH